MLSILRGDGFAVAAAYRAFLLIDSYLYGFMLQELNWSFDETQTRKMAAQMAPQIAAAGHKHVAEVMLHLSCEPGLDRDEEFERGLGLVLDGLERLRE